MSFVLTPAKGEDFINREALLEELLHTLANPKDTNGVALHGLRRMGKTSLLLKLVEELKGTKSVVPVYISLWELSSRQLDVFSNELVTRILEAYAPRAKVKEKIRALLGESRNFILHILKSFKLSLDITEEISTSFTMDWSKGQKTKKNLIEKPFQLAEELGKKYKCKTAIFIDEFPDLIELEYEPNKKLDLQVIRNIRSIIEKELCTSLSIAGSAQHTMNLVALDQASPFYRQFINKEVRAFSRKSVLRLIQKNLKTLKNPGIDFTPKQTEAFVDWLMENTLGMPFYVQCFGRMVFHLGLNPLKKDDEELLWERFLNEEAKFLYTEDITKLSNNEKRIVYAIAPEKDITFNIAKNKMGSSVSNVGKHLISLVNKAILMNPKRGVYEFADPIFQKYIVFLATKGG